MKIVDRYNVNDATHYLIAADSRVPTSARDRESLMKCRPLKVMEDGRVKVVVFGIRNNPKMDFKKRIRYVDEERLSPIGITRQHLANIRKSRGISPF